jgi:hypothetical protein
LGQRHAQEGARYNTYYNFCPLLVEIVDFLLDAIQFLEQRLLSLINFNPPSRHISELFQDRLLLLLGILQNKYKSKSVAWATKDISYSLGFFEASEPNGHVFVCLFL